MKVAWSKDARSDRRELLDYLASENVSAALDADERIDEVVEILEVYPFAGRQERLAGTRELVITGTRNIAAHRMEDGSPVILRLINAARLWPASL